MTKSSVITNRLSITMAGLIIDYLFSSDSLFLTDNEGSGLHWCTGQFESMLGAHTSEGTFSHVATYMYMAYSI